MRKKLRIGGIIAAIVILLVVAIWAEYNEQKEWEAFKVEHNCVPVEFMEGDVGVGIGTGITSSGEVGTVTVVTSTPDKTCWECDDGKRYWK